MVLKWRGVLTSYNFLNWQCKTVLGNPLTFKQGAEVPPACYTSLRCELSHGCLQEEHWDSTSKQKQDVRNQKGPWDKNDWSMPHFHVNTQYALFEEKMTKIVSRRTCLYTIKIMLQRQLSIHSVMYQGNALLHIWRNTGLNVLIKIKYHCINNMKSISLSP